MNQVSLTTISASKKNDRSIDEVQDHSIRGCYQTAIEKGQKVKYSYELMDKATKSEGGGLKYLFQEYRLSAATYYRWLKKYKAEDGTKQGSQQDLQKKCRALLKENMKAYEEYISTLIIAHTDVDIQDLLENTKHVFTIKTLTL